MMHTGSYKTHQETRSENIKTMSHHFISPLVKKNHTSSVPTNWGHFRGAMREDLTIPCFQSFSLRDFSLADILNNSFFK